LFNTSIAVQLLGKLKSATSRCNAFQKKSKEDQNHAIKTAAKLTKNAHIEELLEDSHPGHAIALNRVLRKSTYKSYWQKEQAKKHNWAHPIG
jgi:maltooligosyltrehalose synthase